MKQKIRVLELNGSPHEMGFRHGRRFAREIRHYARERVRLSGSPAWTGRQLERHDVLELAEACLTEHRRYAPDLIDELQGMADATGLSLAELIIVNGFTDFIDVVHGAEPGRTPAPAAADQCTAFLVPAARTEAGMGLFGQTWDMHDSATEHVIMLRGRPAGKPEFLAFTTLGCIGMIGMNEAGISVGINNLLGAGGQPGVTWPFAIRRILEQDNLEDALRCITQARLAGAHNYLLLDAAGRGCNVEAMPSVQHVTELAAEPVIHTNHCLTGVTREVERVREPASQRSSEARLATATRLLEREGVTVTDLQELTREQEAICITATGPDDIATCGAAVMQPATREFWAVLGLPSENEYQRFTLAAAAAGA
jgi:isopenicillin-N N-acyltransferase-like protein